MPVLAHGLCDCDTAWKGEAEAATLLKSMVAGLAALSHPQQAVKAVLDTDRLAAYSEALRAAIKAHGTGALGFGNKALMQTLMQHPAAPPVLAQVVGPTCLGANAY